MSAMNVLYSDSVSIVVDFIPFIVRKWMRQLGTYLQPAVFKPCGNARQSVKITSVFYFIERRSLTLFT